MKYSLLLITLLAVHVGTAQPVDSIHTLPLDQVLYSRGQLGGMAIDRLGFIYVANFADAIWRISPDGEVKLLSDGMYGSSGIAVDRAGNVYQADFFGHTIHKIDRFGNISRYATEGLSGPVGIIFDNDDNLVVCNCSGNTISRIDQNGTAQTFSKSALFNCPNGIVRDESGFFYVTNFGSDQLIRIDKDGHAEVFATVPPGEGIAHIAYFNNNFYITKIKTNTVYQVNPEGESILLAGNGKPEDIDGGASASGVSTPNGIAVHPVSGDIYINTLKGPWNGGVPTEILVRRIDRVGIREILSHYLDQAQYEEARNAFWTFTEDPARKHENFSGPLGALGWQMMRERRVQEAIEVFQLQAEAYEDQWRSHYNLAEVYKIIGQNDKARILYEKALALDPGNTVIENKLLQLPRD
jgi:hypothetical protein